MNANFWRGKKVFLTGHTGFKGSWLTLWLIDMGAIVKGYSLEPTQEHNLYQISNIDAHIESEYNDIREFEKLDKSITQFNPDIVIHLAAQPLVRESYVEPLFTFETNIMGTVNLLKSATKCSNLKSIVVVTTDKVYENVNKVRGYKESDILGGHDPYSSSKACTELVVSSFKKSYLEGIGISIATARAGNVIGGGDWSKERLMPDVIASIITGKKVVVRNPFAVRPWQHVLEPLSGYLLLAEKLYANGINFSNAYNFGPEDKDCKPVRELLNIIDSLSPKFPGWIEDSGVNPHETEMLKLDISKAKRELNWKPKWTISEAAKRVIDWHDFQLQGENMSDYCLKEINSYLKNHG